RCWSTGAPPRPSRSTGPPGPPRPAWSAAGTCGPAAAPSWGSRTTCSTPSRSPRPSATASPARRPCWPPCPPSRTGRMQDIVATIQAEQDRIIRSDLPGVLVAQGGPGTGKTAVAPHRAAYLLYTHRQRLARRGVLVVGPNPTFLRYIEQVLPSLGETDVLLSTVGGLFPGVAATGQEPLEVAAVKGDPRG